MTQPKPEEFMTELAAGMVTMHETYRAAVAAGFTEEQAMSVIIAMLSTMIQRQQPERP